jgi:hypothetical protein
MERVFGYLGSIGLGRRLSGVAEVMKGKRMQMRRDRVSKRR